MTRDVEQEIRAMVRAVDEAQAPVTWREAQQRAAVERAVPALLWSRRPLIIGGALAVAAALTAMVIVAGRGNDTAPAGTSEVPTSTGPVEPTTAATVPPPPEGTLDTPLGPLSWRHVEGPVGEVPGINGGVVRADGGFVAIENPVPVEDGNREVGAGVATLWRSTAGGGWAVAVAPWGDASGSASVQRVGGDLWLSLSQSFHYRDHVGENRMQDDAKVRQQLWKSADGRSWTEVTLPAGVRGGLALHDIGGSVWLTDTSGRVWSEQAGTWVERLSGTVRTPSSTGLDWDSQLESPVTVGEITIRVASSVGTGPDLVALLGLDADAGYGWNGNDLNGRIDLVADMDPGANVSQGPPAASLSVRADGSTVRMVDDTGREVYAFSIDDPGFDAVAYSELVELTSSRDGTELRVVSPRFNSLLVQGPDGVTTSVIPPWGGLESPHDDYYWLTTALAVADGQFVAFVSRYSDATSNHHETWTSEDGVHWEGPTPIELGEGHDVVAGPASSGDRIGLSVSTPYGQEFWYSADGRQWRPGQPQGQAVGEFTSWAGGGVLFDSRVLNGEPGSLWFSADLASWERVGVEQLGISRDTPLSWGHAFVDDLVYVFEADVEGSRSFWVLTLDGAGG